MIHLEIKFSELLLRNKLKNGVVFDAKIKFHFGIEKFINAIITHINKTAPPALVFDYFLG